MKRRWKRELENRKRRKMEKKKKITGALKMKLLMETAQTQIAIKTDISFMKDTDEEIDTEEEEWIEYVKRSTDEAIERMKTAKIQSWIKAHRRMKWSLAMRIGSLPEERWVMKAAGWNLELSTKYKTYRAAGRPKRRWEDEINDFLRPERTEDETSNVERSNNEWIKIAKDQEGWKKMENKFAMAAAAAPGTRHQRRRRTVECA